jgi:general nucleoside transport system permease protein
MSKATLVNLLWKVGAVALALVLTTLLLLAAGAPPLAAYTAIFRGALGSGEDFADVLVAWVPLMLATAGLLITFTAGLWNIGIEGQIILGAVGTTWALRLMQDSGLPSALTLILAVLAGMIVGAIWASLAGALKTFGGVNEIFGGLGLNFVATAFSLWLIFGPWKRPGVASMSGTVPFDSPLWLPTMTGSRLSLWAVALAVVAIVLVYILLRGTYFGLRLKAVGKNPKAAYLLGVPTWQHMMAAFALCGVFAGAAGAMQVTAVYHRLIPSISSGYGYLGLMVAMLVNYQAAWAVPVALFFAMLNLGGIQLPIVLQVDSSLSGVIQGTLVLSVLLVEGARQRFTKTPPTVSPHPPALQSASAPIVGSGESP